MKSIFIWILLSSSIISHSQEINVGVNVGLVPENKNIWYTVGGNFEYRPKNAFFSINTDPFVLFYDGRAIVSKPVYFKVILGKKLRFCPSAGVFVRTTRSYGGLVGFHLEYVLKDKFILFSKNELYQDYYRIDSPDHFGGSSTTIVHAKSFLFSLGVKMMLKNKRSLLSS